jgi:hypothetical protein
MSKITIPPASQKILAREAGLLAEMEQFSSVAFEQEKQLRLEAARDGSAAPKAIKELAEINALEREMHEQREARYHALLGLRDASYPTFRDEVIKLMLVKRQARRESLDADVQDLRKKYPALDVHYDHTYDSGSLSSLRDLCSRDTLPSNHMSLADIVNGYAI